MIEVEKRTFLSEEQYNTLIEKYNPNKEFEKQITTYFNCPQDFRLMETKTYMQLWIKGGKLHDDARCEKVVKVDNKYSSDLKDMLSMLNYETEIIWYRSRFKSKLNDDTEICIDYTAGYGYILEIEKQVEFDSEINSANEEINKFFKENNIEICDKEIFNEKYKYYKENYKELTKDINKESFLN